MFHRPLWTAWVLLPLMLSSTMLFACPRKSAYIAFMDELFDAEATRKVANRAVTSAALSFAGGGAAMLLPLPHAISIPFLAIAIAVAISAIRTLNHHEAAIIGGARHVGIVLAALGALAGVIGLVTRVIVLVRG
jgi:hypothetical protein